jgi:lactoylglutathione lyase
VTRPFRVLGVQQIAIGGEDRRALAALWVDLLGLESKGTYRSEAENVDEEILSCGPGRFAVEIDLMEPVDVEARPRVHVPALNHIGLWIDELEAAVAWLQERGIQLTPGGIRRGAAGHRVCFVHPTGGGRGVLIELVEAPPEVVEAFDAAGNPS